MIPKCERKGANSSLYLSIDDFCYDLSTHDASIIRLTVDSR